MSKQARPDYPIADVIANRWSPYGFNAEAVAPDDLAALFEAARWAPSSYNEQPWRYLVATRDQREDFERLLACLAGPNQAWAQHAGALALGMISRQFARNGKPNKAAEHDLGLASANLLVEATHRGLFVHQMIGLDPQKARAAFNVPEGFDVLTGLAIGHRADPADMADEMAKRDTTERSRKPLAKFVFASQFGQPASF